MLDYAGLKNKQRALRHDFPETMGLRVHRAISWIGAAEDAGTNHDARFLFLWIAFNAAYADERKFLLSDARTFFQEFFGQLVTLDHDRRIYNALWEKFSGPIRLLMDNHYIFSPFWRHQNGIDGFANWNDLFSRDRCTFMRHFKAGRTDRVLGFVFDRLYVLRNQIMHGGSTWCSSVNRAQVQDGGAILGFLMPIFVDIMLDNPQEDWGKPFYPVVP